MIHDGTQDVELANVGRPRQQPRDVSHNDGVFNVSSIVGGREKHGGVVAQGVGQQSAVVQPGKHVRDTIILGAMSLPVRLARGGRHT